MVGDEVGVDAVAGDEANAVTRPREDVLIGGGDTGPGNPLKVNKVPALRSVIARRN